MSQIGTSDKQNLPFDSPLDSDQFLLSIPERLGHSDSENWPITYAAMLESISESTRRKFQV